MSRQIKDNHKMLCQLADALVEDILNASDEEMLREAKEDNCNLRQEADKVRALYQKTCTMRAKKRLLSAQEELAKKREQDARRKLFELNPSEARKRLEITLKEHPEAASKLTLAARKGGEISDADVLGMLEDLEDLGISSLSDKNENQK